MYETRQQPLLSRTAFARRLFWHLLSILLLIALSLLIGLCGYHFLEGLPWTEAFLHASILLAGSGPISIPQSLSGRLFLGLYGLYANLVFIAALGILLTPIAHRMLHLFHLEEPNHHKD